MTGNAITLASPAERAAYAQGLSDALSLAEAVAAVPAPLVALSTAKEITHQVLARDIALVDPKVLRILRPFQPREAIGVKEAAGAAGVSESAVRAWCTRYAIGRHRVGSLLVSRVALTMLVEDDLHALVAYLRGVRRGSLVAPYLDRFGLERVEIT